MSLLSWITVGVLVLAAGASALAWRRWHDAALVASVGAAAWFTTSLAGLPAPVALAVAGYGALITLVLRRSRRAIPRVAVVLGALALVVAGIADFAARERGDYRAFDLVTAGLIGAGWLVVGSLIWSRHRRGFSATAARAVGGRPVVVVLNPSKYPEGGLAVRAEISAQARSLELADPVFLETTPIDAGLDQAKDAVAAGAGVVIACGGDGTVRACADALAGTEVALGIVPVGTGNLLARNLGLPMDAKEAVRVALTGRERRIDLGVVDGQRFAVMAGIGFDAAMVAGTSERLKSGMGWPAYLLSGARHLFGDIMRVTIKIDGGPELQRRARLVLVGNVGRITGGIPLLPDAAPDDGLLDVVILTPRTLLGWAHVAGRVLTRNRGTGRPVERHRGKLVEVRTEKPHPRELDGDNIPDAAEFVAEIEPAALTVRVP